MKLPNDNKKFKLTVFLIKESYRRIEDFLSFNGFNIVPVETGGKQIGTLIYKGALKALQHGCQFSRGSQDLIQN